MVTREEVAQRAGVSTMTVTRVVTGRGYVSDATRRKVRKVIDQLGYIPNKIASGLVSGKSNRIAIVVPDLTNPYYLQVVGAMIEEAKRDDYVISVYKANEEELPQVLESLISNRVAGVVNYASEFPAKYVRHLEEIGARLIRTSYGEGDFKMELIYERAILPRRWSPSLQTGAGGLSLSPVWERTISRLTGACPISSDAWKRRGCIWTNTA